jgi:hypothetical protein
LEFASDDNAQCNARNSRHNIYQCHLVRKWQHTNTNNIKRNAELGGVDDNVSTSTDILHGKCKWDNVDLNAHGNSPAEWNQLDGRNKPNDPNARNIV